MWRSMGKWSAFSLALLLGACASTGNGGDEDAGRVRPGADSSAPLDASAEAASERVDAAPDDRDATSGGNDAAPPDAARVGVDAAPVGADAAPVAADAAPVASCPTGVVCVTSFPFTHGASTTGAPSDIYDHYGCAPATNESGPEVRYRVDVPAAGFLALTLSGMPTGVDIDVHLLASENAADLC